MRKFFFQEYKIKAYKFKKKEDNLYYTVNKGDNLYLISKKYNVTISKLINFNNIDSPYKIFPNQKIFIPKKRTHIVKRVILYIQFQENIELMFLQYLDLIILKMPIKFIQIKN